MDHELSFEKPDPVVLTLRGEWQPEEVLAQNEKIAEMIGELKEIRFLVDLTDLDNMPPKARETLVKNQLSVICREMALVTKKARLRVLGSLVLKMLPSVKKSKTFETASQARDWLNEEK
ncbi:STAS/SEC14 domain-containing protein [candidate division WOR-3 bacterium]|nr:STAS/SEC14 domain-containing protein [candidate division WOR-3 bacterium]